MATIKELTEKRAAINEEMTALAHAPEKRGEVNMTTEELDAFEEKRAERDKIDRQLKALEAIEEEDKRSAMSPHKQLMAEEQSAFECRAFLNYMRGTATPEERAALTIENSGVLVPTDIERDIIIGVQGAYGVLPHLDLRVTNHAHAMTFPYVTGDMDLQKVEIGQTTSEGSASFKGVTLGAIPYKLATIPVSETLLKGSDADVRAAIVALFTEHIGRGLSKKAITSGTDTKDIGALLPKVTEVSAVGDALTFADVINTRAKVKAPYNIVGRASWLCNSNTKNALLGLVDKNGRPLYIETLTAGEPDRLLGHPVIIDDNMPDIGAGNTALVFGDLKAYKMRIVDGIQIKIYNESKYSEQGCIGMQAFVTADGRPVVEAGSIEPLAGLKF